MKRALFVLVLLLAIYAAAIANILPVTSDGGEGGGAPGDTLKKSTMAADTVGPVLVNGADRVYFWAQWKGDSATINVDRSIDGFNWATISPLTAYPLGADSGMTVAYAKFWQDTLPVGGFVGNAQLGKLLRMRISKVFTSSGGSPITKFWGVIQCGK
jgi:hypothetical protein